MAKRSLYMCSNAKVKDKTILCAKGHFLGDSKIGMTNILRLARGEPLEYSVCQSCTDYDEMGPPVPPEDRGWMKSKKGGKHE